MVVVVSMMKVQKVVVLVMNMKSMVMMAKKYVQ
jgi:hypothetical protein